MKLIKFRLSDFPLTSIDDKSRTVWVRGQGEQGSEEEVRIVEGSEEEVIEEDSEREGRAEGRDKSREVGK